MRIFPRAFFTLQESPVKQKTLREDAHSREIEICRKRPRSAREFCKQNSLFLWKASVRMRSVL